MSGALAKISSFVGRKPQKEDKEIVFSRFSSDGSLKRAEYDVYVIKKDGTRVLSHGFVLPVKRCASSK